MRKKLTAGLIFAGALALGLMMGDVFDSPRTARSAPEKPDVDEEEMEELRDFGDKFGKLFHLNAEKVSPSVVWIQAEKTVKMRRPGFDDPFFRRFFGPDSDDMFGEREREFRQEGLGSGFIISEEGHILTNNHVVAEADKLRVKLANGEEFAAEVAGADPSTELAVIQMEGDFGDLEVAELGDSDDIRVGEWVIAIGNPMGLERTVSSGIVSAKGRNIGLARYENLIQTDAAINPGNSGGPLINLQGEVIGINTAIVSRTGGNMGIGLAVPINVARSIIEDLKAGREVERGFLGIAGADLSPELAN
ncbi:MAG: S1C family serine protease, partial [Planctomycetota bacterium]